MPKRIMKSTEKWRRHKSLMKKIKAGIWTTIGVTAGICLIVSIAGASGNKNDAVADTVQSEEQQVAGETESVEATTATMKKRVDMKEMTEGRVVVKENILKDSPNYGYTGEMDVKGLMIHSIGVPITSAEQQANIFADENYHSIIAFLIAVFILDLIGTFSSLCLSVTKILFLALLIFAIFSPP